MGMLAENLRSLTLADQEYLLNSWTSRLAEVAYNDLNHQIALTDDIEDLHWLMTQSDWMQAHIATTGNYNNFLRDVRLAWDVANKAAVLRPEMIGRQVRYALLQTSINSLSSNIHPATLLLGLRAGLWDEKTALTYARQVAHGMTKVTMLTEIGMFLRERHNDEHASEVLIDALVSMREIEHPADYVKALMNLAPCLPQVLLSDALALAQEIADREDRAKVLSALAPYLSSDLMEEALEVIREIHDWDSRALALRGLAPYLPIRAPSLLNRMLEMVQDLYGGKNQADVLITLIPHMLPDMLPEASKIALFIHDPCYGMAVWLALDLYEDSGERLAEARKALFAARDAYDIEDRATGIALLAPHLPEELIPEAFAIARTIGDKAPYDAAYRAKALVALAPRLPDALQAELIAEVLKWNIFFFPNSSEILVALIPYLPPSLFPTMLAAARSIIQRVYAAEKMAHLYPEDQVPRVLLALFSRLPRELMPDALEAIEDIEAERARGYALARIAPYLPEELVPKARELIGQLKAVHRVAALTAFAERGFPGLLDEALKAAQRIQEADESTEILPALLVAGAPVFPPEKRSSVIDEALKIALEIDDAYYRVEALLAMVASLPPERRPLVVQEALTAVDTIQEPREQFLILCKLIEHLPPEQQPDAVDKALTIALKDLGEDKQERRMAHVAAMARLAPFLSERQREEAVTAAQKVKDPKVRSQCLAALAPYFPPARCSNLLSEALKAARRIKDEEQGNRFEALTLIALRLPVHQRRDVLREALKAAEKVGEMYRSELGPALAELFADLPPALLPSAVRLARQLWSPQALTALVPRVSIEERSGLLDEALAAIRQVKAGVDRAQMLANLIPYAAPDRQLSLLEEALQAMQHLALPTNWSRFSQVLWSLASIWAQLPQPQAYDLWVSAFRTYARYRRSYFLAALTGLFQVITALGGSAALTESMNAVLEICCHWLWGYQQT